MNITEAATTIGEAMYLAQENKAISQTYMRCIAREGLAGVKESNLDKSATVESIAKAANKTISSYFCGWGEALNKELSEDFARTFKST